ncbi:hypothetical protein MMC19_002159 [Ptychographa xylographoides]|nr:hypothetical protein [Ptychographa xylographoides]
MPFKQALVFGASGVSGWAIVRECLSYPTSTTFSRVVGLANRPLDKSAFLLSTEDERLEVYSGIDLSIGPEIATERLTAVPHIEKTTHVYFTAYAGHGTDYHTLKKINVALLSAAVQAVKQLCPHLEFWTLQTGGKAYGVEFYGQDGIQYHPPLRESSLRIPEPYASNVFYYAQYDELARLNVGQNWRFCEIRPDVIVGFVPQGNAMGFAEAVGLWLSLYVSVEGEGKEVVFPGDEEVWKAVHSDTSQDVLAQFHVFASLHPEEVSERAFNIADEQEVTWEKVWPGICDYFGLKGVGPKRSGPGEVTGSEWVQAHKGDWDRWAQENGLKEGAFERSSWEFMDAIVGIPFGRQYDLSAARKIGFEQQTTTVGGYHKAFDRMRQAKIIP